MERNFLLTIEYDGSGFSGWQRQPDVRTAQGELESVLSHVMGKPIQVNGTSRTDAGVHALGQQASFSGEFGIPTDRIQTAVNNLLAGKGGAQCCHCIVKTCLVHSNNIHIAFSQYKCIFTGFLCQVQCKKTVTFFENGGITTVQIFRATFVPHSPAAKGNYIATQVDDRKNNSVSEYIINIALVASRHKVC